MKIILATISPYRIEAMKYSGIEFESQPSNVEEYFDGRPDDPESLVKHLSKLKAEAVARRHIDSLVLGFDSVGYFKGRIIEKPKSYEEAFERLLQLSGKKHEFYTGITLINTRTNKILQEVVVTKIDFRELSEEEIKRYLDTHPQYSTYALGYAPLDNLSSSFVKRLEGDHNNLLRGIPLSRVIEIIREELHKA